MIKAQPTSDPAIGDDGPGPAESMRQAAFGSLAALFDRHHAGLVRLGLLIVGDQPTAEDVVQDVFVKLHARADRVWGEDALAYVRAAVLNGCRSELRRRAVVRRLPILSGKLLEETTRSVEVIDAATCNASTVTGCSSKPALVRVPGQPVVLAVDANTNTIYVGSYKGDVSVINGVTCDAADTSGCPKRPASLKVGSVIRAIAVDPATGTVYAGITDRVAIVDGRSCGGPGAGVCAKLLRTIPVGQEPSGIAVDAAANAIYVSGGTGTVTVLSRNSSGPTSVRCAAHRTAPVGSSFFDELADPASHTLYLTTVGSGVKVFMINTTTFGATGTGCGTRPLSFTAGPADELAADPGTHTVYVANGGSGTLALVNDMTCNSVDTRGCPTSRRAPS